MDVAEEFVLTTDVTSDASLVQLSLAGDRDAFGQIVARYQSSICALAYSACGNVARSEDIAQEIFITAWRRLSTLQDPEKLRSWLYGIARNVLQNAFRQHARNPVGNSEPLEDAVESAAPAVEPDAEVISKEEESIMWHVLSGLPEIYREPMVLFYRKEESVPEVAEVLGISEEAVRQRLTRGRTMLTERVGKLIQKGLRSSGPKDAFAVAVISSLPVLAATTTAQGAVMGVAATNSAGGQTTGAVGFLKSIASFAGLIAIPATLGSYFGYKLGQDATGLPHQRKSAAKFWRIFGWGLAVLLFFPLMLALFGLKFVHQESRSQFLAVVMTWMGLAYPFVAGCLVYWAWQRRRGGAATVQEVPVIEGAANDAKKRIRRIVLMVTGAAAGLLIFCLSDMNHNVTSMKPEELRSTISQSAPEAVEASIMVYHYRSMWRESSEKFKRFLVKVTQDGKKVMITAPVDDETVAFLAQKGIACPTYVQGRDFEILGMAGRLLPLLLAFVLGIGVIFLIKRRAIEVKP